MFSNSIWFVEAPKISNPSNGSSLVIALSTITPFGSKYNILSFVSISSDSNNEPILEKTPITTINKKKAVKPLTKSLLNLLSQLSMNDNVFLIFLIIFLFIFKGKIN